MNIVLVGNQNSGKSSLFNALCGSKQKVGNWPGVTVDKKEGKILSSEHLLIDLPGTYSLIPYSLEEEITVNFLKNNKIDLIINVIDPFSLQRSLYLTTVLKELGIDMILVISMSDLLKKNRRRIKIENIEKNFKCSTFLVSSQTKDGLRNLVEVINKKTYLKHQSLNLFQANIIFNSDYEQIEYQITKRYEFIDQIVRDEEKKEIDKLNNLDKIFLNKYWGIPLFLIIMGLIYYLSIGLIGGTITNVLEQYLYIFQNFVKVRLQRFGISTWLISLVSDGVIAGVGTVLTFLPQLFVLFFLINILESSGYMSRIALLFDRLFSILGLSGKSLIPLIVGSGCSVPAIMSSKCIENEEERKHTIALIPFIPCSAKIPLIVLISSNFFPKYRGLIAVSLYFLSFIVILLVGFILKLFTPKNQSTYISELPSYRFPYFPYVIKDTFQKIKNFIVRAGTIIFLSSIIIWCLAHINLNFNYDENITNSLLAGLGKFVSPIFYPILHKNSWEASISILQGIIAKEQVVSSMEIISQLSRSESIFSSGPFDFFTPITAYAFCVFNMFSCPCISTIATMKKELKSFKSVVLILFLQTFVAWLVATFISLLGGV